MPGVYCMNLSLDRPAKCSASTVLKVLCMHGTGQIADTVGAASRDLALIFATWVSYRAHGPRRLEGRYDVCNIIIGLIAIGFRSREESQRDGKIVINFLL